MAGFVQSVRIQCLEKHRSQNKEARQRVIDEMISGQKVVRAFGQEKAVQDFDEINDELAKYYLKGTFFHQ